MRILVTGSKGFTASHLLPLLKNDEVHEYTGDILSPAGIRHHVNLALPERVYHLAAVVPIQRVEKDFSNALWVNVGGTKNLLDAVAEFAPKARVLITGSSDEYGRVNNGGSPIKEGEPLNPVTLYGVTKVAQELLARTYCGKGLDIVFTRTFNFTGPNQPKEFVCSSLAHKVAAGGTVMVGNMDIQRDFSDIRDVVRAYTVIMDKGVSGEAYNVCSSKCVYLRRVLKILSGYSEVDTMTDLSLVRNADIPFLWGNNSKLRALGWVQQYSLEDTLKDLLNSVKEKPYAPDV